MILIKRIAFFLIPCFFISVYTLFSDERLITVLVGESKILDFPYLKKVAIGDATIADVKVISDGKQIMITGLIEGRTNLALWKMDGTKDEFSIRVLKADPNAIIKEIKTVLADVEGIKLKVVNDKVIIDGEVYKDEDARKLDTILQLFPQVISFVKKAGMKMTQMIEIDVKMMEIQRGDRMNVGFNWFDILNLRTSLTLNYPFQGGKRIGGSSLNASVVTDFDLALNLIQSKGWGRLLSNPVLICRNGERAKFSAGGEIPVPKTGAYGNVDVTWKEFGVILEFEPQTDTYGNISLKIKAETSDLDYSNAVQVSGFTMPALITRRSETSVNIVEGETIMLAELMSIKDRKIVEKTPILGHIPVIGELFKSRSFQEERSNFYIFVSPKLVKPGSIKDERIKEVLKNFEENRNELKVKILD